MIGKDVVMMRNILVYLVAAFVSVGLSASCARMHRPCPGCGQKMERIERVEVIAKEQPAAAATRIPLIGEDAPAFTAETTQGPISFPKDYAGKWVILFSHPADFTPVCTTEFMTFGTMMPELKALNCELVGLSIDSNFSHIAWLRTIREKIEFKGMKGVEITFPVIADVKMDVAKRYGMLQPAASDTKAVRAVFMIDPKGKIRAMVYYPATNGRNLDEVKRLLIALQTADKFSVATPVNWQPGDDVIVPAPGSCGAATERMEKAKAPGADYYCLDWFLCLKKLSKEKVTETGPATK
jgi:peroxiredoxin 2/4